MSDPSSPFRTYYQRFEAVLGDSPRLHHVVATDAHEGAVYAPAEDALYFTTVPRRRDAPAPGFPQVSIKRLALDGERFPLGSGRVSVLLADAIAANGMAADRDGRLVVCEQGSSSEPAAIVRVDPRTGAVATLLDNWRGLRLNSPNDIAVKSDGTLWFTDPSYGHIQGFKPRPQLGDYVYRYDPGDGRLTVLADDFDKPNGLTFSPDERVLYVTDSGANQDAGSYDATRPHHIRAFDVVEGQRLGPGRLFAVTNPGFPDGTNVDDAGRVYASSFAGVQVFATDGELMGEITLAGGSTSRLGASAGMSCSSPPIRRSGPLCCLRPGPDSR